MRKGLPRNGLPSRSRKQSGDAYHFAKIILVVVPYILAAVPVHVPEALELLDAGCPVVRPPIILRV